MNLAEPRLGIFREGDTVPAKRRAELLMLPNARQWAFELVGNNFAGPHHYILRYKGQHGQK